ncbi:MAG: hypothetical protein WBD40_18305 [Tepidisphaeraceae bacterium]
MIGATDNLFVTANYLEAALWGLIGVAFLLHAIVKRSGATSLVAAVAFFLFALSDVIETRTGAWWRPWWLLVLKGSCVAVFLVLLLRYAARRKQATPDTARPAVSTRPSR